MKEGETGKVAIRKRSEGSSRSRRVLLAYCLAVLLCVSGVCEAQQPRVVSPVVTQGKGEPDVSRPVAKKSPAVAVQAACPDYNSYKNAYFGDLHVHTAFSLDASAVGTMTAPQDAFAFGRGKPITLSNGSVVIIDGVPDSDGDGYGERPLDFLAVTDHAEWFDDIGFCLADEADEYGYYNAAVNVGGTTINYCEKLRAHDGNVMLLLRMSQVTAASPTPSALCDAALAGQAGCDAVFKDLWKDKADPGFLVSSGVWATSYKAAQDANNPCNFTAFNAYEYSGNTDNSNMHRNIIFADENVVARPLDYIAYPTVDSMLKAFDSACTGNCDAVLIPHNPNDSQGLKWKLADATEAKLHQKWEPLVEVIQHKGASECYNRAAGEADADREEWCDFEISEVFETTANVEPGYIRNGLDDGLVYEDPANNALGIDYNPFRLGFIGSTDTHNSTPGNTREDTWPGHLGGLDATPWKRLVKRTLASGGPNGSNMSAVTPQWGAGGLAGVWAEENTRASLFSALKRRETFATSGPRMKLRVYQTWDSQDFCADPAFPKQLVDSGAVPMGSTFSASPDQQGTLHFVVQALRDPATFGVDLEQTHLIQAVLQPDGTVSHEFTYKSTPGSDVCVTFDVPNFDPSAHAYWYVRVIQAPTARWSKVACASVRQAVQLAVNHDPAAPDACSCVGPLALDKPRDQGQWFANPGSKAECTSADGPGYVSCYCACEQAEYECLNTAQQVDVDVQERAWSSPIWYEPLSLQSVSVPLLDLWGLVVLCCSLVLVAVMRWPQ